MKGKNLPLKNKFDGLTTENLYISEITLAELKFGIAKSPNPVKNQKVLDNFLTGVQLLPIYNSLDIYAQEKARLQRQGTPIDDFDLLIGATAVAHHLIMVTNNTKHFKNIQEIELGDWMTI